MNDLVFIKKHQAVCDSLQVAEKFGKRHDNVMRAVGNLLKNEVVSNALKNEVVIAKRMKERQSAAGGDKRSVNAKNIASDHLVNSDKTTKRAELAKIAGTSQGSIQRTKLILDKGTPEQIERAEKGGKGYE